MFTKIWNSVLVFAVSVFVFLQPAFAAETEEKKAPDWVLSYFLILLFLSLAIVILLRSSKRSETVFTPEELTAQKEEAMKKIMGH